MDFGRQPKIHKIKTAHFVAHTRAQGKRFFVRFAQQKILSTGALVLFSYRTASAKIAESKFAFPLRNTPAQTQNLLGESP